MSPATCSRAFSSALRACWPVQWILEGFPQFCSMVRTTAPITAGDGGVVAL